MEFNSTFKGLKSSPQRVDVVAARKIASVKKSLYETSTGMDAIYGC